MKITEKKFIDNEEQSGLLIIPTPTGSGKSYVSTDILADDVMSSCSLDAYTDRKYIFTTPLLINLKDSYGVKTVQPKLKKEKEINYLKDNYLLLKSHEDSVRDFFSSRNKKEIDALIKSVPDISRPFYDLRSSCDEISRALKTEYAKTAHKDFEEKERIFRITLKKYLKKTFKTPSAIHDSLIHDEKWQWVTEMYPDSLIYDKKYIVLSVDKLVKKIDPIFDSAFSFNCEPTFEGSVIFMDEFDACKARILNTIISDGTRTDEHIDLIALFSKIYYSLKEKTFPARCFVDQNGTIDALVEKAADELIDRAQEVYSRFNLKYVIKNENTDDFQSARLLFHDDTRYMLQADRSVRAAIDTDHDDRTNWIRLIKSGHPDDQDDDGYNIEELVAQIEGFFKMFALFVGKVAYNLMAQESSKRESAQLFEKYIHSVLGVLGFDGKSEGRQTVELEFLTNLVSDNGYISRKKTKGAKKEVDLSFYERGFKYYSMVDDDHNAMITRINYYYFGHTPEKILLDFCQKFKVIGLSATAGIDSGIGNFDLDYLRYRLQDKFVEPSSEDKRRMNEEFKRNQNYSNVNIHTELIGTDKKYSDDQWANIYPYLDVVHPLLVALTKKFFIGENFHRERYWRIAKAFSYFIHNKDIRAALCILNALPKETKSLDGKTSEDGEGMDLDVIKYIFKDISSNAGVSFDPDKDLIILESNGFAKNKDDMRAKRKRGNKLFVMSCFNSIGSGQNLQYEMPDDWKKGVDYVSINDRKSKEIDFDMIYVDKPTNLITNTNRY